MILRKEEEVDLFKGKEKHRTVAGTTRTVPVERFHSNLNYFTLTQINSKGNKNTQL